MRKLVQVIAYSEQTLVDNSNTYNYKKSGKISKSLRVLKNIYKLQWLKKMLLLQSSSVESDCIKLDSSKNNAYD